MKKIVVIDDNKDVLISLKILFKNSSYQCEVFEEPDDAIAYLDKNDIDLVIQDMNFQQDTTSGIEGLELLAKIRLKFPTLPVILFTAWGNIDLAVQGIKNGANNFFSKPWDNKRLLKLVDDTLVISDNKIKINNRKELEENFEFVDIIGESPELLKQLETAAMVAKTDASILIQGENGTGKDLLAKAIHQNSLRKDKNFIKVNIGGISDTLFHSEMFGHVKGAFTDAKEDRKGRFEIADGGTLFLDEIGELSIESQVKLLRVLQDGQFEALGSNKTVQVDVRIISATNVDLKESILNSVFREDLFYRLNTIEIHMPSLNDRRSDIPLLAKHFLKEFEKKYSKTFKAFSNRSKELFTSANWDGNIRELRHVIERSVLTSKSELLDLQIHENTKSENQIPEVGTMTLDELEKEMILKALNSTNFNMTKTSKLLGINRTSLYRRLEKHNISY